MPIKRYKLIGTNMMARNKGEWVRWDDVKVYVASSAKLAVEVLAETKDETISDNERSRK